MSQSFNKKGNSMFKRIRRKLNNNKPTVAAFLVMIQIICLLGSVTGCGKNKKAEVPELLEPRTAVNSYRPVKKRTIGKIDKYMGIVVPKDDPVYSTKGLSILKINVEVGDYVNAGDVVAEAYDYGMAEEIDALQKQITSLNRQKENTKRVSDETLRKLGLELSIEEYLDDSFGISEKEKEIKIERENQRFSLAMLDNSIRGAEARIAKLREKLEDIKLIAPSSGRVSFVKDVIQGNFLQPYENVVVISDYNKLYIETDEIYLEEYSRKEYKSMWTYIGDKKVNINARKHTNGEISYAISAKKETPMQFEVPGEKLSIGSNIVLFFSTSDDIPKIVVGNDSINFENGENYVYVKNEKTGKNERRDIEVGVSDGKYTEVLSGLSEGELVFYQNSAIMPEKYTTEVASVGDYIEETETKVISLAYPRYSIYTSDIGGRYMSLHDLGPASSGDALFTVYSSVENAMLMEARDAIEDLDIERKKAAAEYERKRNSLTNNLGTVYDIDNLMIGTDTDAIRDQMYIEERVECEMNILDYNEEFQKKEYEQTRAMLTAEYEKLKKGTSKGEESSDYVEHASEGGKISFQAYTNEQLLEKGSYVMSEELPSKGEKTKLLVLMTDSSTDLSQRASLGTTMTLKQKNKSWTGTCIGLNGNKSRYMLLTKDGRPCATYSAPFAKNVVYQYYVEMDSKVTEQDLTDSKMYFNGCTVRDVVLVPGTSVKTETSKLSNDEKYYVWKIEDGEVVKEYVDVYHPHAPTSKKYILNGVEPGDTVLK